MLLGSSNSVAATLSGGTGSEKVTWTVSNSSGLQSVSNGNNLSLTALSPGNYTITASYSNLKAYCYVTVPAPVVTITTEPSTTLKTAEKMTVTVSNIYDISVLSTNTISWSKTGSDVQIGTNSNGFKEVTGTVKTLLTQESNNTCTATLYYYGVIAGTSNITATFLSSSYTDTVQVTVKGTSSGMLIS